jgi:hypothetical protein
VKVSCTAIPVKPGITPAASMASVPDLRWQNNPVNSALLATCSQCSAGHQQTGLIDMHQLGLAQRGSGGGSERRQPGRGQVSPGGDGAGGHRGAEQLGQQRGGALDRQVPSRHRYTAIAAACGPYCTGAVTPAGPAAVVSAP